MRATSGAFGPATITSGSVGNTPVGAVPNVQAGTSYTVAASDVYVVLTNAAAITLTLPTPASNASRVLWVKGTSTGAISSASSNVIPLTSGATPGTAIAAAGKWCGMVCDGSNWAIFAGN